MSRIVLCEERARFREVRSPTLGRTEVCPEAPLIKPDIQLGHPLSNSDPHTPRAGAAAPGASPTGPWLLLAYN